MFLPPFLGYAETHFAFLPGLSLLARPYPEIITDAPTRVRTGGKIPLLLLIKDAHNYPVILNEVEVVVYEKEGGCIARLRLHEGPTRIEAPFFAKLFELECPCLPGKYLGINTRVDIEARGKRFSVMNDNCPFLSHGQMRVFVAPDPLPSLPDWHAGDAHIHTQYSASHVEYGAPIAATACAAKAMGLSWMVIADHSYDLMCRRPDYLQMDPGGEAWTAQQKEIAGLRLENFVVLAGEEVSCGNRRGQNVHLLAIEPGELIAGSGDGARRKWNKNPEFTAPQAIARVRGNGGLAYAAHPFPCLGWLQRCALNRGSWSPPDLAELNGLQFWNGERGKGFYLGRREWIRHLLKGQRLGLLAGSDAHGDFNRERRLHVPFVSLGESAGRHLGKPRTWIQSASLNRAGVLQALANGQAAVTDGPFLALFEKDGSARYHALSSPEFGGLHRLRVMGGRCGEPAEKKIAEHHWAGDNQFQAQGNWPLPAGVAYLRGELTSRVGEKEFLCMTSPIWLI